MGGRRAKPTSELLLDRALQLDEPFVPQAVGKADDTCSARARRARQREDGPERNGLWIRQHHLGELALGRRERLAELTDAVGHRHETNVTLERRVETEVPP